MNPASPSQPARTADPGVHAEVFLSADRSRVLHLLPDGAVITVPASRYQDLRLCARRPRGKWPSLLRLAGLFVASLRLAFLIAARWPRR